MSEFQNTHQAYLSDLVNLLKEDALESLTDWRNSLESKEPSDKVFYEGQLLAYYKVLDLMRSQAESFDIPLGELNWGDFDVSVLLLTRERASIYERESRTDHRMKKYLNGEILRLLEELSRKDWSNLQAMYERLRLSKGYGVNILRDSVYAWLAMTSSLALGNGYEYWNYTNNLDRRTSFYDLISQNTGTAVEKLSRVIQRSDELFNSGTHPIDRALHEGVDLDKLPWYGRVPNSIHEATKDVWERVLQRPMSN